jgi:hypothetical protein
MRMHRNLAYILQAADTPGSLLTFEDNNTPPLWFEDQGDSVHQIHEAPECDITDLTLECETARRLGNAP